MTAYYNEIDPYAAQWLRNLIGAGYIAPGIVDERSIEDVYPSDLREFTQCHFFAGVGVWSHALRRARWSDDRPVWTGSCPCQPFSAAGKGAGFDDERHLWPDWFHLIEQCGPAILIGEQVASKDTGPWIDLVQDDLEALGYAFGAVPFPAAGVGAPHIRDRLYWVAGADQQQRSGRGNERAQGRPESAKCRSIGRLADTAGGGRREERANTRGKPFGNSAQGLAAGFEHDGGASGTGPVNGLWRDADWLLCRDGRWRPVEPGASALAHGAPARVGRLRAYGNAINVEAARAWIESVMEAA